MGNKEYIEFYLQTSMYTYLGPYSEFAKTLPDDIEKLCNMQRLQTIHPAIYIIDKVVRKDKDSFYGDMTQIPEDRLDCEEDIFPTAIGILAELLRRDPEYSVNREAKNKIQILCRGNAVLLASILKAKNIPARVRTGFAKYHYRTGLCDDQWNTEYYDYEENKWIMVDSSGVGGNTTIPNEMINIPKNQFITGAEAWIGTRNNTLKLNGIKIMNNGGWTELEAAWVALVNDFNAVMNNEIPVIFEPKYLYINENGIWKLRGFTEKELEELDLIAKLMLDIEKNFDKLKHIYNTKTKFKKLLGISTWNS